MKGEKDIFHKKIPTLNILLSSLVFTVIYMSYVLIQGPWLHPSWDRKLCVIIDLGCGTGLILLIVTV